MVGIGAARGRDAGPGHRCRDRGDTGHRLGDPGIVRTLVASGLVVWAGCFSPTVPEGLPCGAGMACPAGQTCTPEGLCMAEGVEVDAPSDAAPSDAAPPPPIDADTTDAPPSLVMVTFGPGETADSTLLDGEMTNYSTETHTSVELNAWAGLYRFDVSAIPDGATITSVELEVGTIADGAYFSAGTARIYRLTETWDEASVSFFERMTGVPWSAVGADPPSRDPTLLAEFSPTKEGRFTVTLPSPLVQAWVDGTAPNAGLIIDTSANAAGHLHLGAKEGPADQAAALRVSYLP
jgi:hypothetical protein